MKSAKYPLSETDFDEKLAVVEWEVRMGFREHGERGRYAVATVLAPTFSAAQALIAEPALPEDMHGEILWTEIHRVARSTQNPALRIQQLRDADLLEDRLDGIGNDLETSSGFTGDDMLPLLTDEDAGVRCSAARALATIDPAMAVGPVTLMAENDPNKFVQSIARSVLRILPAKT